MISVVGNGAGTYTVQLKSPTTATVTGGTFTLTERSDVPGEYFVVPTGAAAGDYRLVFLKGGVFYATGPSIYSWNGSQEITPTLIASDAKLVRQILMNNAAINETANTGTIFADDGTTPLVIFDLSPNAGNSLSRTRRA